jgi:hypothetical protein
MPSVEEFRANGKIAHDVPIAPAWEIPGGFPDAHTRWQPAGGVLSGDFDNDGRSATTARRASINRSVAVHRSS